MNFGKTQTFRPEQHSCRSSAYDTAIWIAKNTPWLRHKGSSSHAAFALTHVKMTVVLGRGKRPNLCVCVCGGGRAGKQHKRISISVSLDHRRLSNLLKNVVLMCCETLCCVTFWVRGDGWVQNHDLGSMPRSSYPIACAPFTIRLFFHDWHFP